MAPMVEDKRTITAVGTSLGFVLILPCPIEIYFNIREREVIQEGKKIKMYFTGRKQSYIISWNIALFG